jgi:hypothetical protein
MWGRDAPISRNANHIKARKPSDHAVCDETVIDPDIIMDKQQDVGVGSIRYALVVNGRKSVRVRKGYVGNEPVIKI